MSRHTSLKRLESLGGKKGLNDLNLPTITDDRAEDVVGMQGRIRLQKNDRVATSTWIDAQRNNLLAYEYLCHIGEAKEWIEGCIQEEISPVLQLEEALRNGIVLAKLANWMIPGCAPKIFQGEKLQFRHSDNINYFFAAIKSVGLPTIFWFELTDLYDKKNIPKVIFCIHALSYLLSRRNIAPYIRNLVGHLHFTSEELYATQKGLDASGVTIPNFRNLSLSLRAQLQDDEEDIQRVKTPELITEEDESDEEDFLMTVEERWRNYWTTLEEKDEKQLHQLVTCQALLRRWLAIRSLKQRKQELYSIEKSIIVLQAYIRGCMARYRLWQQRQLYDEVTGWIWRLQAFCRGCLVRKRLAARAEHYLTNVEKVIKVQQHIKARHLKRKYNELVTDADPSIGTVKTFVHLLDDSELDFDSEINLEEMRQQVIERIRENNQLDAHINTLDIQIALFLKNATTMEEVMKHSGALKRRKQRILKQQAVRGPIQSDPHSLTSMDMASRQRLELYQHLIYLLQTEPKYLARLLSALTAHQVTGQHTCYPLIESTVLSLFGYATNAREEYLMINLCKYCITEEIKLVRDTQEFLRGNYAFMKLILQTKRDAKERKFFKKLVCPLVTMVIENKSLDLETDPISIYQKVINEEESTTGLPTCRPAHVTVQDAMSDEEVRNRFISHLRDARETTEIFLNAIISSVDDIPYGVRVIARELRLTLEEAFPMESPEQIIKIIGYFIYYRYLNPAIIAPEQYDVVETIITPIQRRNLAEVSKMLQYISSGKVFDKTEQFISPLNDYVMEAGQRFSTWFMAVTEVESPESHFGMDTLTDHTTTSKPMVYMTPTELFHLHYVLQQNMDILEPDAHDAALHRNGSTPLFDLVSAIGPATFGPDKAIANDITIRLTLSSHRDDIPTDEASWLRQTILDTKRLAVYVIKLQNGQTLLDILRAPVTQENESRWEKFKQLEFLGEPSAPSAPISSSSSQRNHITDRFTDSLDTMASKRRYLQLAASEASLDLYGLTFDQLKQLVFRLIIHLERCNAITSAKGYQDVINMIAQDITGKNTRRLQRTKEVVKMRSILDHLRMKCDYLLEQGTQYEDYLNGCMTALANKTSKNNKKTKSAPIYFSRQYFHLRGIQKSGMPVPRFGSYKYTAKQLQDRGILVNIDYADIKKSKYDRINMVFSMDQAGIITVEAGYSGWKYCKKSGTTSSAASIKSIATSNNTMSMTPSTSTSTARSFYTSSSSSGGVAVLRADLRYEDLLQAQFEGTHMITLLDDAVKVNLNLLIYFINKRFYC